MIKINLVADPWDRRSASERNADARSRLKRNIFRALSAIAGLAVVGILVGAVYSTTSSPNNPDESVGSLATAPLVVRGQKIEKKIVEKPQVQAVPIKYIRDDRANPPICFAIYTNTNAMMRIDCNDVPNELFSDH